MRAPRLVVAVLAGVVVSLASAPSAFAVETGQITGRVTDAVTDAMTQAGIEGLEVCAGLRSEVFRGHCALTGANGEYTIPEVPTGSYIVEFFVPFQNIGPGPSQSNLDYAPQYYDGKNSPAEAEEVTVTAGETTRGGRGRNDQVSRQRNVDRRSAGHHAARARDAARDADRIEADGVQRCGPGARRVQSGSVPGIDRAGHGAWW